MRKQCEYLKWMRGRLAPATLLVLAVVLLCSSLPWPAFAQDTPPVPPTPASPASPDSVGQNPYQRTVRLSYLDGQVEIYEGDQLAFPEAMVNMPLVQGMRIVTGPNGRAEVQFEDGSVVRAAPNSSFELIDLTRNADGSTVNVIDALSGLTYYELNAQQDEYTIGLGPDTITPEQGNSEFRLDLDHPAPMIADMGGDLQIFNGQMLVVSTTADQSVTLNANDPTLYELSEGIVPNSWDQWNDERDQQLAQINQQADQNSQNNVGTETDNSAWNELNSYGDWYDVPGYGQGWAPAGVGASWDPFGDGAWGYYPGFGYTWISAYPWGWWPYHCGAWNWFAGYGWLWFPGNCGWGAYGGGWAPVVTVWGGPPGYQMPPPPHHHHHHGGQPDHGGLPAFQQVQTAHAASQPIYAYPLVRVDRGPSHIFRPIGQGWHKPPAGVLHWQGKTIRPMSGYRTPFGGSIAGQGTGQAAGQGSAQGSGRRWQNSGSGPASQPVFANTGARQGYTPIYAPVRRGDAFSGARPIYRRVPNGSPRMPYTNTGSNNSFHAPNSSGWRLAPREANPRNFNPRSQFEPRMTQPAEPRFVAPQAQAPHFEFHAPPAPHRDSHPRR